MTKKTVNKEYRKARELTRQFSLVKEKDEDAPKLRMVQKSMRAYRGRVTKRLEHFPSDQRAILEKVVEAKTRANDSLLNPYKFKKYRNPLARKEARAKRNV